MPGHLTPQKTLVRLKREAKRWLKDLRANTGDARPRLAQALPNAPPAPTLRDVQHAVARELGFPGWTALKRALEAEPPPPRSRESLVNRFLDNACPDHHVRGPQDHARAVHTAMRLLDRHPEIEHHSFHTAVVCGDLAAVRRALAAQPSLATTRSPGPSPYRAMGGSWGDLYDDLGPKGWEPLLYLCFTRLPLDRVTGNAVAIARLLLEHGADPNAYFMAGASRYTPLVGAIGGGEEERPAHPRRDELARVLLDAGAEPYDNQVLYNLGFRGDYLWYLPLIHARSLQLGRAADWADPEWSMLNMGPYGSGARWQIEHAIRRNDAALAEWCLAHGASPNAPAARDQRFSRRSLYEAAVQLGHLEIAELLVRHGARRTTVTVDPGDALVAACERGDRAAVQQQAAIQRELLRSPEPLFAAVEHDRAEVVDLLLGLGASPDVEGTDGLRPLHAAASSNAVRAARLLIAHGAEIDPVERNYGNTPLGTADHFQHHEIIDLLTPLSRDVWELTFLGKLDRLREVLAERPERARVVHDGLTPLMWLPPRDERIAMQIVKLFLAHGADPSLRNNDGVTAADRAESLGMFDVADYLRSRSSPWPRGESDPP